MDETAGTTVEAEAFAGEAKAKDPGAVVLETADWQISPVQDPPPEGEKAGGAIEAMAAFPPAARCSLQLVVYRDSSASNPGFANASSLTSCLDQQGTLRHWPVELRELGPFGFVMKNRHYVTKYNSTSLAKDATAYCKDAAYTTWAGFVRSEIWRKGYWWFAELSASRNMSCSNW